MNLTIIKNGSTVLNMDVSDKLSEEEEIIITETAEKYANDGITSMHVDFVDGITLDDVSDISDVEPNMVKNLTLTLK